MKHLKLLILIFLVTACKKKEAPLGDNEFRLYGEVIGMDSGNLYAIAFDDGAQTVDTVMVEKGQFTYEGTIEGPVKTVYVSTVPQVRTANDPAVSLYLEPGIMELDLDVSDIKSAKLIGSKTMDDSYELEKIRTAIKNRYKKEFEAFEANREELSKATSEVEKKKLKWKDDDLRSDLEPFYADIRRAEKEFVENNPESYISFTSLRWLLSELTQKQAHDIYAAFPSEFKEGEVAKSLEKDMADMAKGIPGAKVEEFSTVDINGKPIKMSDFKGKYLLVDFWASWCVPCRKGNPHLLDLYAKYKDKGFEILGVSDDDKDHDAWRKAVKEDGIGVWRHVLRGMKVDSSNGGFKLLDDGISGGYNISTLPTKILINPDGIIIGRYGGGGGTDEDLDTKLAEIFNSNT